MGGKLPTITPSAKCKLRLLKLERVKDYLLMEEEFVKNQELLKPHEERNEEDRSKVRLRPVAVAQHVQAPPAPECIKAAGRTARLCAQPSRKVARGRRLMISEAARSS